MFFLRVKEKSIFFKSKKNLCVGFKYLTFFYTLLYKTLLNNISFNEHIFIYKIALEQSQIASTRSVFVFVLFLVSNDDNTIPMKGRTRVITASSGRPNIDRERNYK